MLWAPSLMKWRLYAGLGCIIRRLDWGWSIRLQDAGPPAVGGGPQLPAGIGGRLDFLTSWAFHVATSMSNRQGSRPPPREVTREGEWWRGMPSTVHSQRSHSHCLHTLVIRARSAPPALEGKAVKLLLLKGSVSKCLWTDL